MDTKEKTAAKSAYIVESPVHHDRRYEIGEEIELTEKEAEPLLATGSVSRPGHASRDAREAPKQRKDEEDKRQAAAARDALSSAEAEHERAQQDLSAAQAKVDEANRRVEVARNQVDRASKVAADLPHTWEQDADALGGDQLGGSRRGSLQGSPAMAPASGAASTPSTPTEEAVSKDHKKK
jgi:hypothetical protein